jgi:hypothetical protein
MSDSEGPKISVPSGFDGDLSGYRYFVTLSPDVPLDILQKAGELCPVNQPCPDYGDPSMGIWIPETKSLDEILGRKPRISASESQEWRKESASSFLGDVCFGPMLDFLKNFRAIVEGNLADEAKKESIRNLCNEANAGEELEGLFTEEQVESLLGYCE